MTCLEAEENSCGEFPLAHVLADRDSIDEAPIVNPEFATCIDIGRIPFSLEPNTHPFINHSLKAAAKTIGKARFSVDLTFRIG